MHALAVTRQHPDSTVRSSAVVCRYAALVMPLSLLPAVVCIAAAAQHSGPAALAFIWAGLGALMAARVLTAYVPFRWRWGVFVRLPP